MTLEERLNQMLDNKDDDIRALQKRVEGLEQMLRGAESGWAMHRDAPAEQVLPVPRLEVEIKRTGHLSMEWEYRLVMRHFLGHCVVVPLGHTRSTGGTPDPWPPRERQQDGTVRMQLPFRDGCHFNHDAKAFGWPAYCIWDGNVEPFVPWTVSA